MTVCSIVLDENPLADFVELPEHLQDLRCKLLLATAPRVMRVDVACLQYLSDVDCPLELDPSGSNTGAVLQWLLNYAVSLEYADGGEHDRLSPAYHPAKSAC